MPISFISEHIEVLFDNDVECKELCQELGVAYHRPPMPNSDPRLIKALLSTIQSHIDGDYSDYQPQLETFGWVGSSIKYESDFGRREWYPNARFVKKLIAKKGRENVKMPYLIKKMLEKKYGKKYD